MSIDYSKASKRIKLANGDLGTILYRFEDHGSWCIAVKWNSGSTLSLIEGVDRYEIMDEEKSNPNDIKEEYILVELNSFFLFTSMIFYKSNI